MGNPKQKWTSEEEGALRAGVNRHGIGKWKNILKDPDFAPSLANRSNIDLKDKWRNLSISTGQFSKDKTNKAPRAKPSSTGAVQIAPKPSSTGALPNAPDSSAPVSVVIIDDDDDDDDDAADDPSKSSQEEKNVPTYARYNSMILEAITSMKNPNGSDIGAILHFIEQRYQVPQNFRRVLSSKLRRLVLQGKLQKVQNCFKMKDESVGTKSPKEKDIGQGPSQNSGSVASTEKQSGASTAACRIAEAENESFGAAEAVKKFERISRFSEHSDSVLQLVNYIHDQCSKGEMVLLKV